MVTPNFTSAMAGFGILYSCYLVIVTARGLVRLRRKEIIETARRSRGLKRAFYAALALGTYDTSPEALEIDHRAVKLLSAIGLPSACMLHGYVGFIFGGIKANPWWSTPLMPVIFLLSAAVSGIALLIIALPGDREARPARRRGARPSPAMARWLWFFLIVTVTLELLEIIMLAYENSEEWHIISPLLTTRLEFSFISIQMIVGSLIPFILLAHRDGDEPLPARAGPQHAHVHGVAPAARAGLRDALERRHRRPAPLEVVPRPALRRTSRSCSGARAS